MSKDRDTVLFISALPYLGGAQVSLATVLSHLPEGLRPALAVPQRGPFVERVQQRRPDVEIVAIPELGRARSLWVRAVVAARLGHWLFRNRERLLAIHANGDSELKLLLPVIWLTRRPVVVWHHRAQLTNTTTSLAVLWRRLRRKLVWAAVSETRRRELLAARVGDDANVVVVPNPIDPADVVPSERTTHDGFVVGYLGCEYEPKGITLLPAIAQEVRDTGARILCVVKGIDRATLPTVVAAALDELDELADVVSFHPRTFAVAEIFAQIDAVLVPSFAESFCRVAAEGMANALPVVASDLPAIRELVEDGSGVLFEAGDAQGAAGAIGELTRNPDLSKSLGREGAARAAAFLPERVVTRLLALYR